MNELISEIQNEIKKVIIGKDEVIQKVMIAILAKGHILMEDVPGVGKTTMAKSFSKVLGLENKRVQFTSDTMPSDIIGFSVYEKESGSLKYKPGAVMTNLLLADEINRTSSKTQSAPRSHCIHSLLQTIQRNTPQTRPDTDYPCCPRHS